MKYTLEIFISLNREKVIELFDNEENLYKWQEGLQSIKHISGEKGKVGSKSEMKYLMGKRKVSMIETITHQRLPEEFHCTYNAGNVFNIQKNFFQSIDDHTTKWVSESEFQFKGFAKIFFPLMKGAFKKQSFKYLSNFKKFAENPF